MMSTMAGGGFLLCCTFILFVATVVAQDDPKADVECTEGSNWQKDCNWCSCDKGLSTCTRKGCPPVLEEKLSQQPECQGTSEWKKREIGNNKCSWCVCESEKGVCNPVQCSKGNGQTSNQTNIDGGQDQPRGNDKNQPTDFGGPQNQPTDFGGPQNQPTDFGEPQNKPNEIGGSRNQPNEFEGSRNQPNEFGRPQNKPNEFGGSRGQPNEFGGSRNQANEFGGPQNQPNEFDGSRNQPNEFGGSPNPQNQFGGSQNQPKAGEGIRSPQNDFGIERNQPNRGQDQPNDIGGSQNQPGHETRNQQTRPVRRNVQNQANEAAGALSQLNGYSEGSESRDCTSGSRWRDRCNWCNCGEDSGAPVCTRKACRPSATYPGPECENNSEWRKREDGICSWCVCEDGKAKCDQDKC